MKSPLYLYELCEDGTPFAYDESMAVACMQGLFNRTGPHIYVICRDDDEHRNGFTGTSGWGEDLKRKNAPPHFWLDVLTQQGKWLNGREQIWLHGLNEMFELTKPVIKGIILWDENVPATFNVASTIAGVEDLIVLSHKLYENFGKSTGLPVKYDLTGKFDGSISGSAKNDAYRWAIDNYLKKGLCSNRLVGAYDDPWYGRKYGYTSSVLERDRLIAEKAFVFDLCAWETFTPNDDTDQKLGTDKETLFMIFKAVYNNCKGQNMTEYCGFYNHNKNYNRKSGGVVLEWEQVYLMSPYNFYQNTAANDVYNQSLHKWAPIGNLKQHRPPEEKELENKVYMCIQICDMDSTTPLYDIMPTLWQDKRRGELPLAWGLNPNLSEFLPDIFEYYYSTATKNDYFCSDASAAGYFNPSRIKSEHWDMVREHNKKWFRHTDMTIAGMVLDGDHPTAEVLKNFAAFAPDGFASLVSGYHGGKNLRPSDQIYDGMPLGHMTIAGCDWHSIEENCKILNDSYFKSFSNKKPEFIYYRICYRCPGELFDLYKELQKTNPDLTIELVDPYTYFRLLKQKCISEHGLDPQIGSSRQ